MTPRPPVAPRKLVRRTCEAHGLPFCNECARERRLAREALQKAPLDVRCAELKARMDRQRRRAVATRLMAGRGYTAGEIAKRMRSQVREAKGER